MFKKKTTADTRAAAPALSPKRNSGGAVDLLAVITGVALAALAVGQFLFPFATEPLTGIGSDVAAQILCLQWLFLALLMVLGGAVRLRPVSIFAAEFAMIGSVAALVIILLSEPQSVAVFTHGTIAVFAFGCSGFARLTDKAELKREIQFMREHAKSSAQQTTQPAEEL